MNQADKIRDINSSGWDGVNASTPMLKIKNKDAQIHLDYIYAKCFGTKEGQQVLEHLQSVTINQPAWVPGAEASIGYAREGQNSIVREIQQRIRRANEPSE